jgi:predicted DCC family thiol-disulfide oxidoreductase YuxK
MNRTSVILFDGICNLCCGWVQFLIRMDKKMLFKFASLQSDSGKIFLKSIKMSTNHMETVVYLKKDRVYTESTAILEILTDLGGIWKAFSIFRIIPNSIRDGLYRFIAKRRYRIFGKRFSCLLPTLENQIRFLT